MGKKDRDLSLIGWREWVALPDLGVKNIKVKVDTGARSSSLHAYDLECVKRGSHHYAHFILHPEQRNSKKSIRCRARILEFRKIRSSNGQIQSRPVIVTELDFMGETWPIEVTLTNRDEMGFRMLLGRESFRGRFAVDAGRSYYGLRAAKKKKKK